MREDGMKYLSKRSLIKHTYSWRVNLLYYEHGTDKQKYFFSTIQHENLDRSSWESWPFNMKISTVQLENLDCSS